MKNIKAFSRILPALIAGIWLSVAHPFHGYASEGGLNIDLSHAVQTAPFLPEIQILNQPVITNSVYGYLNGVYNQPVTPVSSYQVTASNLTDDLIIVAYTNYAYPAECQIQISLEPETGYSDQLTLSPINGTIDTTIFVKPGCTIVPFTCSGNIIQSSNGAQTDEIQVELENEYWFLYAPVVEIGDVEAVPGSNVLVPFFAVTDFNMCSSSLVIDFDPSVLTFIGVTNVYGDMLVCNNCLSRYSCSPIPWEVCQINTMAFYIDQSHGSLWIEIYYHEMGGTYGPDTVCPADEIFFDIEFVFHGGTTDLTFAGGGDYYMACNGPPNPPVIIDEPFGDYYLNGSVSPIRKKVNLELNLEGLYSQALGQMNKAYGRDFPGTVADEITVGLARSTFPYTIEFVADSVQLDQNGLCHLDVPGNYNGEYYIVISHRNSIETWSKFPVAFNQDTMSYNFSDLKTRAYNDNLILKGTKYCIYAADVNQDGFVDTGDMTILDNESNQFATGYNASDANGDGTTDSGDIIIADNNSYTFTTAFRPFSADPSVFTGSVTNITHATASSGGEVVNQGSSPVTSRGICWNTSPSPTISNDFTIDGTGAGNFVSTMNNLMPNTSYYVRAYATNDKATVYGYQLIFTTNATLATITTDEVTDIIETSATSGGNITSIGGVPVTQRGVCWSTLPNPTTTDFLTVDGSGSGSFLSNITGLLPNTLYYVRAYAINSMGIAYGNEVSFSTSSFLPEITTAAPTDITATTAVTGGTVTSDGGASVVQRGVCYSTNPLPTTSNDITVSGSGTGSFISTLTGLIPYTTYYIRAFATNIAGTAYGNEISFTTLAELPTLTTETVSGITGTSAISGGNITSDGGAPVTQRGICWSSNSNPTLADQFTSDGSGPGAYASNLNGLTPNQIWYIRAYAINSAGTAYGNEVSFTTALYIPGNGVIDIENNSYTTVVLGNQEWMGENLKVALYNNGESIQQVFSSTDWSALSTGGWCWMNNDNQYEIPYGKLYNYYAVTDSRNLCPAGWHVPTDTEWTILSDYLGGTAVAGGKMKETGTVHWNTPNNGATNTSSFTGVAGGYRTNDGTFSNFGNHGIWWSSTEMNAGFSWYRSIFYNTSSLTRGNNQKKYGFSVRCVRSVTMPTITTAEVTGITHSSAVSGGNISEVGSLPVLQRGVCWSTSQNPAISDSHTSDGIGSGSYVSNIDGLNPETTYYIRAYASNIQGTAYGNQQNFATPAEINCNNFTLTHIAGSVAPVTKTVTYGVTLTNLSGESKCWITQNLGADQQASSASDDTEPAAGWYWQFNRFNGFKHDGINLTPNVELAYPIMDNNEWQPEKDPCSLLLGIGWRLPTHSEWVNAMTNGNWNNYNDAFSSQLKLHASGFLYPMINDIYFRGTKGFYWSRNQNEDENSLAKAILFDNETFTVTEDSKYVGSTLRCISNGTTDAPTLPMVVTGWFNSSTAEGGGDVTHDGGSTIIAKGVCWSINPNPTLNDSYSIDGSGSGPFFSSISGLNASTQYFIRAYATNSVGTSYGNETIVITPFVCGSPIQKNHNSGNTAPVSKTVTYETVESNLTGSNKCWITQNLGADNQASTATDASESASGWYWQFNRKQGFMHDGSTRTPNTTWISNINENSDWLATNDPCTLLLGSGWRLPTATEWETADASGGWNNYNGTFASLLKLHAAGFLAGSGGSLSYRGSEGFYWSSSQNDPDYGRSLTFSSGASNVNNGSLKARGRSARCLRE
ncbi:MAG: FISUMP domain-containing protein [Bacteroidota bacterium]